MAAELSWGGQMGTVGRRPTLNPLSIRGTVMQPNILLMAKLVTLAFIVSGQLGLLSHHFVPFLNFFRHVGSPSGFHLTLEIIFLFAACSLFLNQYVRAACVVLGLVIIVGIASSMVYYENNREYAALILVLAGLENPRGEPWLLRWQIVLLYFAAALNKVLLADWRDGHFFDAWMGYLHHSAWVKASGLFPNRVLGALLGWAAIITEFALSIGFAFRRHLPIVIWVGVAYHTTLVLVMNRTFGMFWVAAPSAYLAFVTWPREPLLVHYGDVPKWLRRALRGLQRIDVDGTFQWRSAELSGLELSRNRVTHKGWRALLWILLCTPATYFVLVVVAMLPQPEPRVAAFIGLLILGAVAVSVLVERWGSAIRSTPASQRACHAPRL
ncbi:MAG: hypothetical protein ACHQCH_09890 [Solirubrobacterales bacterium]